MKTKIIIASLILSILQTRAQNIENPSFDSVYIGGIDRIYEWITSDSWNAMSGDTVLPLTPSTHFISGGLQYHEALSTVQVEYSNAFHGPLAVKLFSDLNRIHTDGSNFRGFVVNGNHFYTDSFGYLDVKKCGTPFAYRPYSLKGHYKFEDSSPSLSNYPQVIVLLKKYNSLSQTSDTIGFAEASIPLFQTSTWRSFELPINYISNQVPDTIVVAFFSSNLGVPSSFWVDSLGFDFSLPSSINDDIIENDVKYFYQDFSEPKIYFLKNETIQSIKIYDVNGKLALTFIYPASSIDISVLTKGNYLMNMEFKNNTNRTFKIAK